ncbi:MAG TPA: Nif11-like leader peptide family natural product precursor [Trichocoleus sp.]
MPTDAINRLVRAAQDSPALRDRLKSAPNVEAFVKVARGYGYRFTIDEWREFSCSGQAIDPLRGKK